MASVSGSEVAIEAIKLLKHWEGAADNSFGERRADRAWGTLEEERRELFEGVIERLATEDEDSESTAACLYLLRHLALSV